MASANARDGITLTGYTLIRAQTVHGSMPSSESSQKPKPRRTVADFEFFFEEFKQMKEALAAQEADALHAEEDEEENKTKKDGEEEAEWLKQVGLKSLVSDFEDDREMDIQNVDIETNKLKLTVAQRAAVRRRVDTLNATIRRKRRASPICEDGGSVMLSEVFVRKNAVRRNSGDAETMPKTDMPNIKTSSPPCELPAVPENAVETVISDLSTDDIVKIRRLALLELTAMLETHDIPMKVRKAPKIKYKETGIFGVPLSTLLARDKQLDQTAKIPLFLQEILVFLEEQGIDEEGILRIPGATARIRGMIRELEETFYDGDFSWDDRRTNDASTLLKQFLRDLPYPLLTYEYLRLFASVDSISNKQEKLEALNLLVLLLPDEHRTTLRWLLRFLNKLVKHESRNKMSVANVAMIMAPNLFLSRHRNNQSKESDLHLAACTFNVMRMLIEQHQRLWIVPPTLLSQVRQLNETEAEKKRQPKGVARAMVKKKRPDAPMSPSRKLSEEPLIPLEPPVILSKESQERLRNIIRVQSPYFSKVSMAFELTPGLTAGDIVAKFRKKSYENMAEKGIGPKQHPVIPRRFSFNKGKRVAPLDNHHLFEVGGNIGERCLSHDTLVMSVLKVNSNADWVIKQRELDF
eukprot:m.17783 g.17783  ORF g.17783 m.17783 type:complete len:636 (+) comp27554_c1_seq2:100-2007(+)